MACREWQAQLQDVLGSQSVGMLRLETGALKATYTNTLSSAHATVAMLMVVAGRRAAEAAIEKLQAVKRWVLTYMTIVECQPSDGGSITPPHPAPAPLCSMLAAPAALKPSLHMSTKAVPHTCQ